jgi:hypothetical protein
MYDPEIIFEVHADLSGEWEWNPVTYRQDNLGICQEAVWRDVTGRVVFSPRRVRDMKAFARTWDRNLRAQGFVKAARIVCSRKE